MNKPEIIAFYLPQYYPVRENSEWFGEGFTEWTNVGKAKPLFRGHYQPKVPADLGYYDLRLPEVRRRQAELAKEAGIAAFCYYHYWFGHGRQMLDVPLREVVRLGEPDMPFCLCWANHIWYKKTWNAEKSVLDQTPLLDIDYGNEADWTLHFRTLLPAFRDARYYRKDGRLVFVLYRAQDIPDLEAFKACWQRLASEEGLGGFYFMTYVDDPAKLANPVQRSCEKTIVLLKANIESVGRTAGMRKFSRWAKEFMAQLTHIPTGVYKYAKVRKRLSDPMFAEESIVPVLLPNWDNTPRRAQGAMVLDDATPEQFYLHCKETFAYLHGKADKTVFLKSWNEWGEGNYMEPCIRYGHGYIDALRRAIEEFEE